MTISRREKLLYRLYVNWGVTLLILLIPLFLRGIARHNETSSQPELQSALELAPWWLLGAGAPWLVHAIVRRILCRRSAPPETPQTHQNKETR